MTYLPGNMYRRGWDDRIGGKIAEYQQYDGILREEYLQGYSDCHQHIIENERKQKSHSPLMGHPLYKEAHEHNSQQFLSD